MYALHWHSKFCLLRDLLDQFYRTSHAPSLSYLLMTILYRIVWLNRWRVWHSSGVLLGLIDHFFLNVGIIGSLSVGTSSLRLLVSLVMSWLDIDLSLIRVLIIAHELILHSSGFLPLLLLVLLLLLLFLLAQDRFDPAQLFSHLRRFPDALD